MRLICPHTTMDYTEQALEWALAQGAGLGLWPVCLGVSPHDAGKAIQDMAKACEYSSLRISVGTGIPYGEWYVVFAALGSLKPNRIFYCGQRMMRIARGEADPTEYLTCNWEIEPP